MTAVDWAHTAVARQRREAKARILAEYAWDRGITGAELLDLDEERRFCFARAAEVPPPSTTETCELVSDLLADMAAWATKHSGHAATKQLLTAEKSRWLPCRSQDHHRPSSTVQSPLDAGLTSPRASRSQS